MTKRRILAVVAATIGGAVALSGAAAAGPDQHGPLAGHLLGAGDWGIVEFLGSEEVHDAEPDLIADVAVDPDGNYAYLSRWGGSECEGPEGNGPDGGAYVIDITDLRNPVEVGFIATHQDTLVGEGLQAVHLETAKFSGDVLVMNHEQCGKNGKGGVSLWDVTNPLKPKKLNEHFGDVTVDGARDVPDVNQTHSAFAWQGANGRAYLVSSDDDETADVDIYEITDPKHAKLIAELELNDFGITQPALDLTDSFLHDMVVKKIGTRYIMLLSNWDGGYVLLDVTNPGSPTFIGDTEFAAIDPELLEQTGIALTPEGNAHQAEFTKDNRFFIGTDEDFAPYRVDDLRATIGGTTVAFPSVVVGGGASPAILPDLALDGPVVYGGYGCPDSAPIPAPADVPGYLALLQPGDEKIIVLQRGPSGDPSAPEDACFPGEKAHEAKLAGWDAVLLVQRHVATDEPFCGSGAFVDTIVAVCTTHTAFHRLFGTPVSFTYPEPPAIGAIGARIEVTATFDGWGYVHLFDAATLEDLDTYAIPEAMDPVYANGHGALSVHEVATDPQNASLAYLSYYSGGLRAIQIQCADPTDTSTCELVEVGGYLDPQGNNFWGVEAFVRDGRTIVLASDMDYGLYVFGVNP